MAVMSNHDSCIARSTFENGHESLVVECRGNTELLLAYPGIAPKMFRFDDRTALVFFQSDLGRELVRSGWTLVDFQSTCHCDAQPTGHRPVAEMTTHHED